MCHNIIKTFGNPVQRSLSDDSWLSFEDSNVSKYQSVNHAIRRGLLPHMLFTILDLGKHPLKKSPQPVMNLGFWKNQRNIRMMKSTNTLAETRSHLIHYLVKRYFLMEDGGPVDHDKCGAQEPGFRGCLFGQGQLASPGSLFSPSIFIEASM